MSDNSKNYFILERKDIDRKAENFKDIYNLSVLEEPKDVKSEYKNKIQIAKASSLNEIEREGIIKSVKKAILSLNLDYKRRIERFKAVFILAEIIFIYLDIKSSYIIPNDDSFKSMFFNFVFPGHKKVFNITINLNETVNHLDNLTEKYLFDIGVSNSTNITNNNIKKFDIKLFTIICISNQIVFIPFLILIYKILAPIWNKMNDTLLKITNHLLYCDSLEQENYSCILLDNYSILCIKKEFYSKHKNLLYSKKIKNTLPLKNIIKINNNVNKNMFSYCISFVNSLNFQDLTSINYTRLIPIEDLAVLDMLIKHIDEIIAIEIIKYIKRILLPITLIIYSSSYYYKELNSYYSPFTLDILVNLLIIIYNYNEYYSSYQKYLDKLIENYNKELIKINRFIYRKDRLILFFAIKSNNYTKDEIISNIKKIIE